MLNLKTAVVTGGAKGIGAEICRTFVQNHANVAILFNGSLENAENLKKELLKFGTKIEIYKCDVSKSDEVKSAFKKIKEEFKKIDILVNNAGITNDKFVLSMKEEDFKSVIDVNLVGSFNTIKEVYPLLMKQKSGRIINISSISGIIGNSGQANYSSAKAGIIGLTKSVAKELASRSVTCNAIAPGFIKTDMTKNFDENNSFVSSIPMKKMGNPQDVANLALFLASDNASYITGEVIKIDGGLAM